VIPDSIGRLADRVSREHPVRMLVAAIIVAAIATPMALWQQERSRAGQFARAYRDLRTTSSSEIATLRYSMGNLLDEQAQLRELLLESGYAVYSENSLAVAVTATGYSSTVIETDNTPFITASNTRTRDGIVAMSRDMLRRYNPEAPFDFGDIVHISGLGDFVVEDSMNPRWRRRVDVWFPSRPAAFEFGRHRVIVTKRLPDGTETAYNYSLPANLVGTAPPSAVNAP
jgi:3D (Asp-Asp-Asp) domain-containing protein